MKIIHAVIRKLRPRARHPDGVRSKAFQGDQYENDYRQVLKSLSEIQTCGSGSVVCLISTVLYLRTWCKIEREKMRHDRNVTAVKIAFSQDKFKLTSSWQMRDLIYDLNDVLHPVVFQLFIRSIFRHFYKFLHFLKRLFKLANAIFQFFNFLFQESSPVGCGKRRMDDSGRGEHSSAATGGDA
ncbi:hypothetical protein A0U94_06505 [Gluconobacter albidus]|uniref:hypothetical protein n=1 Tax=Gluconobacter albidus TaxID=318683 RepID=UPI00098AA18B|nr:hypothetical protein [Gluconobacter albidus]AQS90674.1 hypothetical protein A0U94_06505 [Gluconobacter albidus]